VIPDKLSLNLSALLRSLNLFLKLRVWAVPHSLTTNQPRHGGKQDKHDPQLSRFHSSTGIHGKRRGNPETNTGLVNKLRTRPFQTSGFLGLQELLLTLNPFMTANVPPLVLPSPFTVTRLHALFPSCKFGPPADRRGLARLRSCSCIIAFDLIELNGNDLRRGPLQVRKAALTSTLAKAGPGIRFNEHLECDDGEIVHASSALKAWCRAQGLALPLGAVFRWIKNTADANSRLSSPKRCSRYS